MEELMNDMKNMKTMNDKNFYLPLLMGPNCLKLAGEAASGVDLPRGARVLDLGCGMGLTSMLLAGRFDAKVFATDLWVSATDNYSRFLEFGLEDSVYPIHAEAHDLPYAENFFDAAFSIDSYHYFGAEEGYLEKHLAPLVKPGGAIVVVVPGLQDERHNAEIPEEMKPFWVEGMNFHSCDWWRDLWERSGVVDDIFVGELACHAEAWADWLECDNDYVKRDIEMMEAEAGKYFNSVLIKARVREREISPKCGRPMDRLSV